MPKGKKAIPVDKDKLTQAIATCEAEETFSNLSALHAAVASKYEEMTGDELSSAVVGLRIGKWKLPIKTTKGKPGGGLVKRKATPVDKDKLKEAIANCEGREEFSGFSALFEAVSGEYKTLTGQEISVAVVGARIRDWKLETKTTKGKRGRPLLKEVDRNKLVAALHKMEEKNNYTGRNPLYEDVAKEYAFTAGQEISVAVIKARVEDDWELDLKTPIRRRRSADDPLPPEHQDYWSRPTIRDALASQEFHQCGCGGLLILVPCGKCPKTLVETDYDSVAKWAEEVTEAGHKEDKHYCVASLKYWLATMFDRFGEEFPELCEHLDTWNRLRSVDEEDFYENDLDKSDEIEEDEDEIDVDEEEKMWDDDELE